MNPRWRSIWFTAEPILFVTVAVVILIGSIALLFRSPGEVIATTVAPTTTTLPGG